MNKICDTLDEYTETIDVFKDADYYLSGYRSNRTIRLLAVLLSVGLPFIIVAAIFFMLPGIDKGNIQVFSLLIGIILVIIGIMLYTLRHSRII